MTTLSSTNFANRPNQSWIDRETVVPVLIGLLLATFMHVLLLPSVTDAILNKPREADATLPNVSKAADEKPELPTAEPEKAAEPTPPPKKNDVELGADNAPKRVTVAWISHDDFQELIAPKSNVIQPAVQQTAPPVKEAPAEIKATPPAPRPTPAVQPELAVATPPPMPTALLPLPAKKIEAEADVPLTQTPARQEQAEGPDDPEGKPAEQVEASTPQPTPEGAPQKLEKAELPEPINPRQSEAGMQTALNTTEISTVVQPEATGPEEESEAPPITQVPAKAENPQPADPTNLKPLEAKEPIGEKLPAVKQTGSDQTAENPPTTNQTPTPSKQTPKERQTVNRPRVTPSPPSRPTSAALSDKEAQPYILDEKKLKGKIGGVLVSEGIEIKTVLPDISPVTMSFLFVPGDRSNRALSAPTVPKVLIIFGTDGKVLDAKIVKTSGFTNIDAPILSSLYKWRASGELLTRRNRPVYLRIDYHVQVR